MDQQEVTLPSIKNVSAEAWQKLSQKKIYFGHQSVGYNIIDGITDLMKENTQIRLNIKEIASPGDVNGPVLAHSSVGRNTDPKSKCDAFTTFMDGGLGDKTDIAFLKFCYVDFGPATDVDRVFEDYRKTMTALKARYPKTIFIHVTAPLTRPQTGPKAWVKRIIGRSIGAYEENVKREWFNEKLRKEYDHREPIFDLAAIESVKPDGTKASFEKDGRKYPFLVASYTNDGGHLNATGRKRAAEQLLIVLAKVAN